MGNSLCLEGTDSKAPSDLLSPRPVLDNSSCRVQGAGSRPGAAGRVSIPR